MKRLVIIGFLASCSSAHAECRPVHIENFGAVAGNTVETEVCDTLPTADTLMRSAPYGMTKEEFGAFIEEHVRKATEKDQPPSGLCSVPGPGGPGGPFVDIPCPYPQP